MGKDEDEGEDKGEDEGGQKDAGWTGGEEEEGKGVG